MLNEIIESADNRIREYTDKKTDFVNADAMGLDYRAGRMYVSDEGILVEGGTNSLNYYGGFQYVDKDYVTKIGSWTFYDIADSRVYEAVSNYHNDDRSY